MQTKMLAVLLVSWLALAGSATAPSEGAAIEPQEHIVQEPIDRLEDFPLQTLLQEELDPFGTHVEQREVFDLPLLIHGEPSSFSPRGRRPVGRPHYTSTLADFPPGRPSLGNIDNICAEGRQKASYKPWSLPRTGFSHLRRQGDALNSLEASLGQCCRLSEDEKLNCSQAAWSDALENFCKAEFMVKTKQYVCCKQKESRRSSCFARAAPFPDYDYAGKTSGCAHGDPARCNPEVPVGSEKLPALFFPPGRPSEGNIKNICKLRKFRPVYSEDSLPQTGFGWFVRQAWALNRLEKEFKKCCPKEDVRCAQRGWEKALTQYCKREFSVKTRPHFCCRDLEDENSFDCFTNLAPFPAYNREIQVVNLAEVNPLLLDLLCGQFSLLSKQKHVPALVQNMTEPCCQLKGDERTQCAQQEKSQFITILCDSPKASWKDAKKCCSKAEDAARLACFDSSYLSNVTLASFAQPTQPTEPAE